MRSTLLLGSALLTVVAAGPAAAETLQGALAKAYANNPTLTGARAGQRAIDETVPIARSQGLPNVGVGSGFNQQVIQGSGGGSGSGGFQQPDRSVSIGPTISVPIYLGGQVRNSVRAAEQRVEAGQASLRATESSLFSQVVGAYMDVLRDQAVVSLNRGNVSVLEVDRQATGDRFEIGDLTRTDVAQSEARLAFARSQLRGAEAQLIGSRERYIRLVGDAPVDLQPPPQLPGLPGSPTQAVEVALEENPDIEAAQNRVEASDYDIRVARAARLPSVTVNGQAGYVNYLGSGGGGIGTAGFDNSTTSATVGVSANIPIFQGGRPAAQIRQAQARSSQTIEQLIETERSVVAQARAAYAALQASQQDIQSSQTAVEANRLSLEGVRAENSVGTRSILDILNAEQELLNSQVTLVTARRDAYVAAFTLLAAMGQAEAQDLGLENGALYDPNSNRTRVRNRIWDWSSDPNPTPQATRTVSTPAQDASVPDGNLPGMPTPVRDPLRPQ